MDWTHLPQHRDSCLAVVNAKMNSGAP